MKKNLFMMAAATAMLFTACTNSDDVALNDRVINENAPQPVEFGTYLGKGLASVADVVNPEIFVIGGGVSKAGEILLSFVAPEFVNYVFPPCKGAQFALATLGNDAGIYGCAGMLLSDI